MPAPSTYLALKAMSEIPFKCCKSYLLTLELIKKTIIEPWHEISNNMVCATSKASDQPAHTRSLIRAFASRLNILRVLSY